MQCIPFQVNGLIIINTLKGKYSRAWKPLKRLLILDTLRVDKRVDALYPTLIYRITSWESLRSVQMGDRHCCRDCNATRVMESHDRLKRKTALKGAQAIVPLFYVP
jgi:hypothetical protein